MAKINAVRIPVKVLPGSSRNGIAGWMGEALRVKVTAPPERGKANAAVEAMIVQTLGLSKGAARIVAGKTSRNKVVEVIGLPEAEVYRRLTEGVA